MDKKTQINFWYIIIAILGILLVQNFYKNIRRLNLFPTADFIHCWSRARSPRSQSPKIISTARSRKKVLMG